ncbi:hypothetical protein BDW02DRAFT_600958 [Decorospora gaudefroyi]|uniref:BZIP domain-containing protein n=1 Tax=Decorospora gaudefroyi TaxID=184978 RepID=A0A6A5K3B7_9PLEO|nr:hypothetical protein BDW02DRAFT_600958 [Decorospora gaudefroyi]
MPTSPASSSGHTSDTNGPQSRRSRVSAEHTLNRVRENQRRHRARQRDRVASLEQKLAETEQLLSEARAEIAALKEDAAAMYRNGQVGKSDFRNDASPGNDSTSMKDIYSPSQQTGLAVLQPHPNLDPRLNYPDVLGDLSFLSEDSPFFNLPYDLPNITTTTGPPPCCSDAPNPPPPDSPTDPECRACKMRPLPSPSESTTLCAQAYVMIDQQNFKNLDPDTIRMWLAQGLRRAQREGEGCRVENGALLRLLDFISGL